MTKKNVYVSVIVPNYNGSKTIGKCIKSILNNSCKNLELIVIDDCSKDSSIKIVKSFKDSKIRLIENKKNSGPAETRNKGIKISKGNIIFFIDSDAYISKDCITQHVSIHKHVNTDIVAGSIQGMHHTIVGQADDFCNWWTSIPNSKSCFIKKFHVPTTNLSVKRYVFHKAGYFKEELKYGEDSEFSNRVIKNGLKIYFKSDLIAYHYDRDSLKSFLKHNYNWGTALIENRASNNMEYSWLLPKNYFMSWLYMLPLALLFTSFIVHKWVLVKPKVILYAPIIFLGKMAEVVGIKDSLRIFTNKK